MTSNEHKETTMQTIKTVIGETIYRVGSLVAVLVVAEVVYDVVKLVVTGSL